MTPALTLTGLGYRYPEDPAPTLQSLSLTLYEGELVSLLGPSGCGKSTVLRLVNGALTPDTGTIERAEPVGYMPQRDLLLPWRTALDNAALPLEIKKVPRRERRERAMALLETVGLAGAANKYPRELSGGMRQRVAFARTLAAGARLLLLDEPFSALDAITRMGLQEWLLAQQKALGLSILFVTHDVEEALFLSHRIALLRTGEVGAEVLPVPLPDRNRMREMLSDPSVTALRGQLLAALAGRSGT